MHKIALKLALLAANTLYAAAPKFQAMYESMQEEEKRITERNKIFKELMQQNEKYEAELASSKRLNLKNLSHITKLTHEGNTTKQRLKDAQKN